MAYTLEEINKKIRFITNWYADGFTSIGNGSKRKVICTCKCGNVRSIGVTRLMSGKTKTCGCDRGHIKYTLTIDEINQKIKLTPLSRLTAIEFSERKFFKHGHTQKTCLCKCICGKYSIVTVANITSGHTLSCGCNRLGKLKPRKYSVHNPIIYSCWSCMISRCYDKTNTSYNDYGGRGVIVCERWKNNYQYFLDWALLNGWEKGLQLDKDIKGNGLLYSAETCTFVTAKVNANNRKSCIMSEVNGVMTSLKTRVEESGLNSYTTVWYRVVKLKWNIEKAINTPKMILKRKST